MSTQPTMPNVQAIPIGAIVPNPNNPRGKHFDKQALEDLAASIKAHGVRQPALLRPNGSPGKYEIVCGERRWRASKLAGKDTLPAIVDPSITDQDAIEIGILENLQREDVHPLDEAIGYKTLLEQKNPTEKKATPETIAGKVGKSASYIYQRLKLAELSKKGQEDFRAGFITAAHAIDIARLQPDDQARALEYCHGDRWEKRAAAPPFRELRQWIQENVQLNLDKAPFDIADAKLIPSAGACTDCPKRTGSNPSLFQGFAGKNTCTDPTCYQAKKMALVHINVDQVAAKHKGEKPILISHEYPDRGKRMKGVLYEGEFRDHVYKSSKEHKIEPGSCPNARLAVYIDDERFGRNGKAEKAGQVITICTAKRSCKVHQDVYSSGSGRNEAEIRRKQRIYREYTAAVFQSIAAVMKQPKREDLLLIAREFFQKLGHYQEKPMIEILGWKDIAGWGKTAAREKHFAGMTNDQLQNVFVLMAVASDLVTPGSYSMGGWTPKLLEAVAGRHGIKLEPLKAAAREKFAKKKAKAKKAKAA